MRGERLARALGWFSIGLGLSEVLAPKRLGRWLGMERSSGLLRAYGFRELGKGVGILRSRGRDSRWLWARVGGDGLDLATLGAGMRASNPRRRRVALAVASVAGVTALDVVAGLRLQQAP